MASGYHGSQVSAVSIPSTADSFDRPHRRGLLANHPGTPGEGNRQHPVGGQRSVQFEEQSRQSGGANATSFSPTPLSEQLSRELDNLQPTVSAHEAGLIDKLLQELLASIQSCLPPGTTTGELLPIGAFHLGVLLPTDDVDIVCTVHQQISLEELLCKLQAKLREIGAKGICSAGSNGALAAPGLRWSQRGVSIQLLLAHRLHGLPPPSQDGVVQSMAALTAREVGDQLLSLVPNVLSFRLLLRFVRFWAKRRGIYGSHLGFFGGTAWAVCCAVICQMNPLLELSQLASRFFRTLSRWDWQQPVTLLPSGPAGLHVEPSDKRLASGDQSSGMSILLPAGNGLSAAAYVSDTTAKIIQKEMRRGYKLVQQVELSRAHWADIYLSSRFFQRHRHYLEFDFMASSEDILIAWIAWGRARMAEFVHLFESVSSHVASLRPWPEWIDYKDPEWPHARAVFMGLHLERLGEGTPEGGRRVFDLREPIVRFYENIAAWPYANMHANQFELTIRHVSLAQVETFLACKERGVPVREPEELFEDTSGDQSWRQEIPQRTDHC
eukprot:gnl/TRDRNA2_/TRDRNA2_202329_c0_seq1.p1 gnl/TRDRNA2_/TRDRNA2_202329_c0~~gnl/TRDRNA2_/TRDRNA2_202329_c0_seq1.p1  ORF type:complete len:553 (+),score=66.97 gnl/TRDRNA2_/TRDRNA2_202329_c0_seq1:84-1742(+)